MEEVSRNELLGPMMGSGWGHLFFWNLGPVRGQGPHLPDVRVRLDLDSVLILNL
jgi:hypothetical protein